MTVVDNRTGKKYEISISEGGTIKATDLKKITAGGDGVGLRTYDPGYLISHPSNCPANVVQQVYGVGLYHLARINLAMA